MSSEIDQLTPIGSVFPGRKKRKVTGIGENLGFFLKWLSNPLEIGSAFPSGRFLADAIANAIINGVDPPPNGYVVEMGAGHGAITSALLQRGIPPDRLVVIERDRHFVDVLVSRFPEVRVVHCDAVDLRENLKKIGIDEVSALISSLPLLSLPRRARDRILRHAIEIIAEGAVLLQYSYGLESPVPARLLQAHGVTGEPVARVWRNLPPAKVWCYKAGVKPVSGS